MPRIGMKVSKVEPSGKNPKFSIMGNLIIDRLPVWCFAQGYLGMTGKTLHITNMSTLKVSSQVLICQHIANNEKKFIAKIKKELKNV